MRNYSNLVEIVNDRKDDANHPFCYHFMSAQGIESITYSELDQQARAIAATLQQHRLSNHPVLLLFEPGPAYIAAFIGCLYANVTAVPCYPPHNHHHNERLFNIIHDVGAKCILTQSTVFSLPTENVTTLTTDALPYSHEDYQYQGIRSDEIAFLQYTSGSTGSPSGVMIGHDNLMANLAAMQSRLQLNGFDVGCTWLPPFHDMGLIGGLLLPLYVGFPVYLMAPGYFLQKPLRWLDVITSRNCTISGAPNFAYDFCIEKITQEEVAQLDLRSWRIAINGAEKINAATLAGFSEKFKVAGFRPETFYPTYGMAESTLIITGKKSVSEPVTIDESSQQVSCGTVIDHHQLCIVDPVTFDINAARIEGEIWIAGPVVSRGYWNKNDEPFLRQLPQFDGLNFYRTGDLGFLDSSGELFVTGRLKETLVIRGKKFAPDDIERCCYETDKSLIAHGAAAFQLPTQQDQFILVQEVRRHVTELKLIYQKICEVIFLKFQIHPSEIILIRQASLPRTSSGKIQRLKTREQYLQHALNVVDRWPAIIRQATQSNEFDSPPGYQLRWLRRWFSQQLNVPEESLSDQTTLAAYGLDSIQLGELSATLFDQFTISLPIDQLLNINTLRDLHQLIMDSQLMTEKAINIDIGLSSQELIIVNNSAKLELNFFNIPAMIKITGPLKVNFLEDSLNDLIQRHEALRSGYQVGGEQWQRNFLKSAHAVIDLVDFSGLHFKKKHDELKRYCQQFETFHFNLQKPPLFKLTAIKSGPNVHYLLLTISHLIADGSSLQILLSELAQIYNARLNHCRVDFPKVAGYSDYKAVQNLKKSVGWQPYLPYWKQLLQSVPLGNNRESVNHLEDVNPCINTDVRLSKSRSQQLIALAKTWSVTPYTMMYALFCIWYATVKGDHHLCFRSLHSGRHEARHHKTVGYLADSTLEIATIDSSLSVMDWIVNCHANILERRANFIPLAELQRYFPEILHQMSPCIVFNFHNYFKSVIIDECHIKPVMVYFTDRFIWGKTTTRAFNIYQYQESFSFRLRGVSSLYSNEQLTTQMDRWLVLLNQVISHPNARLSSLMEQIKPV